VGKEKARTNEKIAAMEEGRKILIDRLKAKETICDPDGTVVTA
jgi:hypothetical protein